MKPVTDEPSLRPFDINVRTQKGEVELSGYVNSRDDMDKAIEVARKINGIRSIKNDMQIQSTGDFLVIQLQEQKTELMLTI